MEPTLKLMKKSELTFELTLFRNIYIFDGIWMEFVLLPVENSSLQQKTEFDSHNFRRIYFSILIRSERIKIISGNGNETSLE
jgi:hypothetical protein